MIKSNYIELIKQFGVNEAWNEKLWNEIEDYYSQKDRFYHNLNHLENLLFELQPIKDKIKDWNVILFTLYYHDVIYKSIKKDNEEKSAQLAAKRMNEIGVEPHQIELCKKQIIATKSHLEQQNSDTNYFTDADLSILGKDPFEYENYCSNIRKEYKIYPNIIYNKGRKKVVNHFLSMDRIFKTKEFYDKYEKQCRLNLRNELKTL